MEGTAAGSMEMGEDKCNTAVEGVSSLSDRSCQLDRIRWNVINVLLANTNWNDASRDNNINVNTTMSYERLNQVIKGVIRVKKKNIVKRKLPRGRKH